MGKCLNLETPWKLFTDVWWLATTASLWLSHTKSVAFLLRAAYHTMLHQYLIYVAQKSHTHIVTQSAVVKDIYQSQAFKKYQPNKQNLQVYIMHSTARMKRAKDIPRSVQNLETIKCKSLTA
jgi:hypothetical protein